MPHNDYLDERVAAGRDAGDGCDRFFVLSPNIQGVIDESGYFTRINPAVEKVLGVSRAEMMARPFIEFVHPDDVPSSLAEVERLRAGLQTVDFQNRYICADGSYKWLSWTAAQFDGKIYCTAHDITAMKAGEESVRESEAWMRKLTESMPQLVFVCRPDGWNTYFNQQWVDYTGLSQEESHGHGWTQVFHPDEQTAGTHAKEAGGGYVTEARLRGKDGVYRWFLIRGLPLYDADGAVGNWLGTCTDIEDLKRAEHELSEARALLEERVVERTAALVNINEKLQTELTERKRTEDALRDTKEMLQLVMNHIPQAIFWKDLTSTYMGCNFRLARDAGFDCPSEVVGKTCYDMPWAEQAEGYRADDRIVMDSDTPKLNIEEQLTTAEGAVLWLRTNKIPLHDQEGHVVGVLGSYEDITEQKMALEALYEAKQEAERANHAKSEFLSRMSHELRTPLNAILGFGQLLEMGELSAQDRDSVGHILKGGRHLLGLINEVLDIAKVESGHTGLSMEPVSLGQAVGESCAMLKPLAAQANIELVADMEEIGKYHVQADVQRLKQVLINLLSNGIKYNRPAGQVRIECAKTEDGNVRVCVRDTGLGISVEDLGKLFTPFQRLNAASLNIEGSGLGLVLSRRLTSAMGGSLEVESVVGEGTTFTIVLPDADSEVQAMTLALDENLELPGRIGSEREYSILCVEDNVPNLRLINGIFGTRPDIKVITAMQGSVGFDLARQHQPDLILLDLDLPDISGKEVLRRLRESEATQHIPVIIVSADATKHQRERLLAQGADAYLTKPLNLSEFMGVVEGMLRREAA